MSVSCGDFRQHLNSSTVFNCNIINNIIWCRVNPLLHSEFCCAEHSVHQVSVYPHLMGHPKEPVAAWRFFFISLSEKGRIQLLWNVEWKWFHLFAYAPVQRLQWGAALGCGFHTAQQGARCFPCQIHPAADRSSKGEPHEGVINECSWGVMPRKELYSGNAGQAWTAADIKTSKAQPGFVQNSQYNEKV